MSLKRDEDEEDEEEDMRAKRNVRKSANSPYSNLQSFQVELAKLKKRESTRNWQTFVQNSKVTTHSLVALILAPTTATHSGHILDGNLSGYQKKKYVCKLLYIYILGWDVDIGHMEAINLLTSTKYSEKQIVRSSA